MSLCAIRNLFCSATRGSEPNGGDGCSRPIRAAFISQDVERDFVHLIIARGHILANTDSFNAVMGAEWFVD